MRSTRSTDALNTSSTSRYWPVGNCNVVLVGDAKVGKTNLVNRATQDKFNEVRHPYNIFDIIEILDGLKEVYRGFSLFEPFL